LNTHINLNDLKELKDGYIPVWKGDEYEGAVVRPEQIEKYKNAWNVLIDMLVM